MGSAFSSGQISANSLLLGGMMVMKLSMVAYCKFSELQASLLLVTGMYPGYGMRLGWGVGPSLKR